MMKTEDYGNRLRQTRLFLNNRYGVVCAWIIRAFLLILVFSFSLYIIEVIAHPEYGNASSEMCNGAGETAAKEGAAAKLLNTPSYRLMNFSVVLFASAVAISLVVLSYLFLAAQEYPAFVFTFLTVIAIAAAAMGG